MSRIVDMDNQELKQKLKSILLELQNLVTSLDADNREAIQEEQRTHCPVCGESLSDGARIVRGVHERCYQLLRRNHRLIDAEQSGVVFAKSKSGRKSTIDVDMVLESAKTAKYLIGPATEKIKEHRQKPKP